MTPQSLTGGAVAADWVQLAAFVVGGSSYALDIMRVREILRLMPIIPVREAPSFVEGVFTLRGSYIPAVSMRRRLGLQEQHFTTGRILITMAQHRTFGLIIDSMTEVVRVPRASLQQTPMPQSQGRVRLVTGLCDIRGQAVQLLNINALVQAIPDDATLAPQSPA